MLITTQEDLDSACKSLGSAKHIAVDTEFMRGNFYYPQICLIQVAYKDIIFAVDMLANLKFSSLIKILEDKSVLKVFHSASQDIEAIYEKLKCVPNNIFDTQIAAGFLGFDDSPGYEKLTKHYLNQALDKDLQYSHWQLRPISDRLLQYALKDVEYLYKIYITIRTQLKELGYYEFAKAESKKVYKQVENAHIIKSHFLKVSDAFESIEQYIMLAKLVQIRENYALKSNTRRNLILTDDNIVQMIKRNKVNPTIARKIGITNLKMLDGVELDEDLQKFVESTYEWKTNDRSDLDSVYSKLMHLRDRISKETKISNTFIATSKDLKHFILSDFKGSRLMTSWRKSVFAAKAINLINNS